LPADEAKPGHERGVSHGKAKSRGNNAGGQKDELDHRETSREKTMQHILITGGTGTLGRQVATQLRDAGYQIRLMSRSPAPKTLLSGTQWARADLETGQGLAAAVQDIDTIVHTASSPLWHSQRVDVDGTRQLIEQARAAAVSHIVYISIVGIDRMPFGYYRSKLAAEALIQSSGLPWSLLRATQFHSFLDGTLQSLARIPLLTPLPTDLRFQPIAESEVARRLGELVQTAPTGRVPDIGGPEVQTLGELAQSWLTLRKMHRIILPVYLPGKSAQAFRQGYTTCPGRGGGGKITWAQWVRQKYGYLTPGMTHNQDIKEDEREDL
jgi:uncharacterized protein YbjT (DUF2867 family)